MATETSLRVEWDNIFNARHTKKLDIDRDALANQYENGYFLLHHSDQRSHNPADYADSNSCFAQGDMRKLSRAVSEGACIAASYSMLDPTIFRVGYIEADTEVEYLTLPRGTDGDGIYKAVKFDSYLDIRYVECPVLFTASTRQGSSFANWNNEVRSVVRSIALDEEVPRSVFSLSDGQFELLCNTWLDTNYDDYHLRLPVGKTMKDIDIIATADNCDIAAQVTFVDNHKTVDQKVKNLEQYGTESTSKHLFARETYSDTVKGTDISFHSATTVFEDVDNDREGQCHLNAMLDLSRIRN